MYKDARVAAGSWPLPRCCPLPLRFSGMPIQLATSLQHVGRLAAGWVPAGTLPELEDAVLNKRLFPIGDSFLLAEKDR